MCRCLSRHLLLWPAPEQIEGNITYHIERFFTLASGIDHIESPFFNGVSIVAIYFQPDTEDLGAAADYVRDVLAREDLPFNIRSVSCPWP